MGQTEVRKVVVRGHPGGEPVPVPSGETTNGDNWTPPREPRPIRIAKRDAMREGMAFPDELAG